MHPLGVGDPGCVVPPLALESLAQMFAQMPRMKFGEVVMTGGGNPFWLLWSHAPIPGLPLNRMNVGLLRDTFFKEPTPVTMTVVMNSDSCISDPSKWSRLHFVSPEELWYGLLLAIDRDVAANRTQVLRQWKQKVLASTFHVVFLEEKDVIWKAIQLRDEIELTFETQSLSTASCMHQCIFLFKNNSVLFFQRHLFHKGPENLPTGSSA